MMNISWTIERYNASTNSWSTNWQLRLVLSWDVVDGADNYVITYNGQTQTLQTFDTSAVISCCTFLDHNWDTIGIIAYADETPIDSSTINAGYFIPTWASEPTGDNTNGITMSFELNEEVGYPIAVARLTGSGWNGDSDWSRLGTALPDGDVLTFHDESPVPDSSNDYRAYYETDHYSNLNRIYLEGGTTITELQLPPSDITLSNNTISYADAHYGQLIGTVSATDPNRYDSTRLDLIPGEGDNVLFRLSSLNDLVIEVDSLDVGDYNVVIRATDQTNRTFDKICTVSVLPTLLDTPNPHTYAGLSTIQVSWDAVDHATGYECAISEDGVSWEVPVIVTEHEFEFANVESETLYYIRVRATNNSDNYSESEWAVIQCLTLASPSAPTDILLSNNHIETGKSAYTEVGTLTAIHTNLNAQTSFAFVEGDNDNDLFFLDSQTPEELNELLITSVANIPVGSYTIEIRATDSQGATFDKLLDIIVTRATLDVPTGLYANSPSKTSFICEWNAVSFAAGYIVQCSEDGTSWDEFNIQSRAITLNNLRPGTTYQVRVAASGDDASFYDSAWSNIISYSTLADTTPPEIALLGDATCSIRVGGLYTDPGITCVDDTDPTSTVTVVIRDENQQEYDSVPTEIVGTYTITYTATDASGNSSSVERVVTVSPIHALTSFRATAISQQVIRATWGDALSLPATIERRDEGGDTWDTLATNLDTNYFDDDTAVSGRRYWYRITLDDTLVSNEDVAWLSTIVHYSSLTQEGCASSEAVVWSYVTEMTA